MLLVWLLLSGAGAARWWWSRCARVRQAKGVVHEELEGADVEVDVVELRVLPCKALARFHTQCVLLLVMPSALGAPKL